MRLTLEQLKAMSDELLLDWWFEGKFPFEFLKGSVTTYCACMTGHTHDGAAGCCDYFHKDFSRQVTKVLGERFTPGDMTVEKFREKLDELYALRLFYDHLYPKSEETADAVEEKEQEKVRV